MNLGIGWWEDRKKKKDWSLFTAGSRKDIHDLLSPGFWHFWPDLPVLPLILWAPVYHFTLSQSLLLLATQEPWPAPLCLRKWAPTLGARWWGSVKAERLSAESPHFWRALARWPSHLILTVFMLLRPLGLRPLGQANFTGVVVGFETAFPAYWRFSATDQQKSTQAVFRLSMAG